jgi:hypothetical protein
MDYRTRRKAVKRREPGTIGVRKDMEGTNMGTDDMPLARAECEASLTPCKQRCRALKNKL